MRLLVLIEQIHLKHLRPSEIAIMIVCGPLDRPLALYPTADVVGSEPTRVEFTQHELCGHTTITRIL